MIRPMQRRRVHAIVRGRVQGVFYRASARREASARGLTGWVRNLPDGSVELVAEGPAPAVEAFLAWCREGPPAARVEAVEVRDEPPRGETGPFVVRG